MCHYNGGAKSNIRKCDDVCRREGSPKSNSVSTAQGLGKRTSMALDGSNTDTVGKGLPGISGADYRMAGCDIKESLKIRNNRKDIG